MIPRILALDLDGTTVDRARALRGVDRRAAHALAAEGVIVTINTGRLYSGTRAIARKLGVEGVVGCMNGAHLVDTRTDEAVHAHPLNRETLVAVKQTLREGGLTPYLFARDGIHYDERGATYTMQMRSWSAALYGHECLYAGRWWDGSRGVFAVGATGRESAVLRAVERIRAQLPSLKLMHFASGRGDFWYLEVKDGREDKGTALERIAALHGLDASDCVAVGDWYNDAPALERAGLSFAMGHAPADLRALCDHTLEATHDTGGAVAEVARRVWNLSVT